MFEVLVECGCNPDLCMGNGQSLLHVCSSMGYEEILDYLVTDLRLGINDRDRNGVTPLHVAAYKGHLGTARALIRLGSDLSIRDKVSD